MVGLGFLMTKLTSDTNKAIKHTESKNEYELIFNKTYSVMNDELSCYETLKDISVDTLAPAKAPVAALKRCTAPESYMVQFSAVGSNDPKDAGYSAAYNCVGSPTTAANYVASCVHESRVRCPTASVANIYTSGVKHNTGNFTADFNFIFGAKDEAQKSGIGQLEITFTKSDVSKKTSLGTERNIRKVDNIFFEYNTTSRRITKCFNSKNDAVNTAVTRSCTGNNARLVGDPNDAANPLRCVHDVDVLTATGDGKCPPNTFLDGYLIGNHPTTGEPNTLLPNCQPFTTKTTGCGAGEYVVEKTNGSGQIRLACHSVPACATGRHLARNTDGMLFCDDIKINCPSDSIMVTRNDGTGLIDCKACATGEHLMKIGGVWTCKAIALSCNDTKTSGQEYMLGINADGTPMCRTLITPEAPCQYGATLTIKANGSVGTTCCPACTAAETANVCMGQSFVSTNSCGSVCLGSKPVKNGVPGPWYTTASCSTSQTQKIEQRNCVNSECGGDNTCSGYNMTQATDCLLYNNQHTFAQCVSNGGSLQDHSSFFLCYYSGWVQGGKLGGDWISTSIGSHGHVPCPSGWAALSNYSSANYAGCSCRSSSADGCYLPGCGTASVSGWWRANAYNTSGGFDARRTGFWGCGTNTTNWTCYASMTQRGCY